MSDPQPTTIVDVLQSDHRSLLATLGDARLAGDDDEALAARERLVMNLVRHFVAEEGYLYPIVRDELPDGERFADGAVDAARTVEKSLRRLEDPHLSLGVLEQVIAEVSHGVDAHVRQVTPVIEQLPRWKRPEELAELGDDVIGSEQSGPTRPRRVVTEATTANRVISFVEGYLDHVRDVYTRRGVAAADDDS